MVGANSQRKNRRIAGSGANYRQSFVAIQTFGVWINQRLKSIEIRKDLTDEWKRRGLEEGVHFATLTDIIYKTWADKTAKEYRQFKDLKKENLRDNMTNT